MHRRKGSGKTGKRNESGVWAFGAVKGIVWNIRKCKGQQSKILSKSKELLSRKDTS